MSKKFKEILEGINREEFTSDYCIELMSTANLCAKYGVCLSTLNKVIAEFNLTRDFHELKSKSNSEVKNRFFNEILSRISYDDLYQYYIIENHYYEETAEHFDLKLSTFDKLLKYYGIKQNRSKSFQKSIEKRIERYGADNLMNQKKREDTIIEKYGSKEEFVKQRTKKAIETNRRKYGQDWKITADVIERSGELYLNLQYNRDRSIEFFNTLEYKPTVKDLCDIFNCTQYCIYNWIERLNLSSYVKLTDTNYEDYMIEFLESCGIDKSEIIHNDRKALGEQKELDLYVPKYNLAIEMNGNYWHSSLFVDRNYHFNKSKQAAEKGIKLLHVYQYEWDDITKRKIIQDIIKHYIGIYDKKIYARECTIKEITDQETVDFLNENHMQGYRSAKIRLGLFFNNKLIEIMTFSKNKTYGWEIIRECSRLGYIIVGGVSKLYKYFLKKYNPNSVFSYCDFNKFEGKSYEKLGMKFIGYTVPDMRWLLKNGKVISRHPQNHKEIKAIAMAQIYGAGSKKYIAEYN